MPHPTSMVQVTPRAVFELKELQSEPTGASVLRLFVVGETCCGYNYGLELVPRAHDGDLVADHDGVLLAVAPEMPAQGDGVTLDFVDTPQGAGISVRGPIRAGGCRCSGGTT